MSVDARLSKLVGVLFSKSYSFPGYELPLSQQMMLAAYFPNYLFQEMSMSIVFEINPVISNSFKNMNRLK